MTEALRLYRVRHNGADTLMWLSDEHAQTYGTDATLADEPAAAPVVDEKAHTPANKSRAVKDK